MQLEGRNIILTGATRGIGLALARGLARRKARVLALAGSSARLKQLETELGGSVQTYQCDLSDAEQRSGFLKSARDRMEPVDGLINNAGIQLQTDFATCAPDQVGPDIAREVAVNFEAPVHLSGALLPVLAKRDKAFVVNITSGLALTPKRSAPVYCATKAGLRSFTTALRYQAEQSCPNVTVTEAIMALVATDMTQGRGQSKISPQNAAEQVLCGIERDKSEIWVGNTRLLKFIHRLFPQLAARILKGA